MSTRPSDVPAYAPREGERVTIKTLRGTERRATVRDVSWEPRFNALDRLELVVRCGTTTLTITDDQLARR